MKYSILVQLRLKNHARYSRSAPCLLQISRSMVKQGLIRSHSNSQGSPGFSAISQVLVLCFGDVRSRNFLFVLLFLFLHSPKLPRCYTTLISSTDLEHPQHSQQSHHTHIHSMLGLRKAYFILFK